MKKLFIALILTGAVAGGIYGTSVAYRNTRALGYGGDAEPFAVTTNEQGQTVYRVYDYIIDLNGLIP